VIGLGLDNFVSKSRDIAGILSRNNTETMIMENKMLKRWLIAGILIVAQGCAGTTLNPFVEKPYFATPPTEVSRDDKELFDRALFRQTNNRVQPAIKVWGQFLEKHPRSFEAHNNLGLVYFEDDQLDASIIELEKALSLEPSESKIKNNLIRALNFKSLLYREANDYNRAVDTLKRVQEISTPEEKEKVGYRIENYEIKAFEQAKRANTLEAYQGFLVRYPKSSKNSDEARMKIEGLKRMEVAIPNKEEVLSKVPSVSLGSEEIAAGDALLEGSLMEDGGKGNMEGVTRGMKGLAEKKMGTAASDLKAPVEEKMEAMKNVDLADKTAPVTKTLPNGFIPVQPLEVPLSGEQKIKIATQPKPKPATGVDPFAKPAMPKANSGTLKKLETSAKASVDPFAKPAMPKANSGTLKKLETSVKTSVDPLSSPESKLKAEANPYSKPKLETISPNTGVPVAAQNLSPKIVARAQRKKVRIVTSKDPLRIRARPTSQSRVLATVAKGSLVPFVREENGWYEIEFSAGQMGWVSKKYALMVK
jgi:tetratricopeptide (TPR) repeat protein